MVQRCSDTGIKMKHLFLCFSVLAVKCVAVAEDTHNATTHCVNTLKYETYLNKRECLKLYLQHIIKHGVPIDTTIAASTANSTSKLTTNATSATPPVRRRRDIPGTAMSADKASKPSMPTGPIQIEVTAKDCSSINLVKNYFSKKWTTYKNTTLPGKIRKGLNDGNIIRTKIFDNALLESKLTAFKKEDFDCIRNWKENLTNSCMTNILIHVHKEYISKRISDVMTKLKPMDVNPNSCSQSKEVKDCVKKVLAGCSTNVLNLVNDLENVTVQECKKLETSLPVYKMSTTTILLIVVPSICGTAAVIWGLMKYLKIRRSSGVHTINQTKSTSEEHEMSSKAKSVN